MKISKTNKQNKFPITIETGETTIMEEVVNEEPTVSKPKIDHYVTAEFGEGIEKIGYVHLATNEENIVTISGGKMQLLHNRMYYIPVNNKEINSDNGTFKMTSDISERFDVRFVRDGFACLVPIKHNATLKNGERLCIVTI